MKKQPFVVNITRTKGQDQTVAEKMGAVWAGIGQSDKVQLRRAVLRAANVTSSCAAVQQR
jgi:hypothetical protein